MPLPASSDSGALFDHWANWLLHHRHGDDAIYRSHLEGRLQHQADRVLDRLPLAPGMQLLDLGTGDGLLAFRALARTENRLSLLLADSSSAILKLMEGLVQQRGLAARCELLRADAQDLAGVADAALDGAVSRAVLAYVPDKPAAFRTLYRVLRPGGRLSIAEPVMRDDALNAVALRAVLDRRETTNQDPLLPLLHRWKAAQYPDTMERLDDTPLTSFTERDLLRFAQNAGFVALDLQLHIQVDPPRPLSWETFLAISPHPLAPTLGAVLRDRFSEPERALFESLLRPALEAGQFPSTERIAYLSATKPSEA